MLNVWLKIKYYENRRYFFQASLNFEWVACVYYVLYYSPLKSYFSFPRRAMFCEAVHKKDESPRLKLSWWNHFFLCFYQLIFENQTSHGFVLWFKSFLLHFQHSSELSETNLRKKCIWFNDCSPWAALIASSAFWRHIMSYCIHSFSFARILWVVISI